jgi:hypothetical protein
MHAPTPSASSLAMFWWRHSLEVYRVHMCMRGAARLGTVRTVVSVVLLVLLYVRMLHPICFTLNVYLVTSTPTLSNYLASLIFLQL